MPVGDLSNIIQNCSYIVLKQKYTSDLSFSVHVFLLDFFLQTTPFSLINTRIIAVSPPKFIIK